jgi:hypothetical protein
MKPILAKIPWLEIDLKFSGLEYALKELEGLVSDSAKPATAFTDAASRPAFCI